MKFGEEIDFLHEDDPAPVKTEYHVTEDDKLIIKRVQDVEPILEANKRAFNEHSTKGNLFGGTFHHVAEIPVIVIEQWKKEGIDFYNKEHWPKVMAKLNDPDYRYLRTMPGRI